MNTPLRPEDFFVRSEDDHVSIPPLISPSLPPALLSKYVIPQLKIENIYIEKEAAPPTDYISIGKELKGVAEQKLEDGRIEEASLAFLESLVMFVVGFYTSEKGSGRRRVREKEWISLVKYGMQIVADLDEHKDTEIGYLQGLCHFVNAFVLLHLVHIKERRMRDLIEDETEVSEHQLKASVQKLLKLRRTSKTSLVKGERQLSVFDMSTRFPRMYEHSLREVGDVRNDEFVSTGANYCLPIAAHTFSLMSMANFGMLFFEGVGEGE